MNDGSTFDGAPADGGTLDGKPPTDASTDSFGGGSCATCDYAHQDKCCTSDAASSCETFDSGRCPDNAASVFCLQSSDCDGGNVCCWVTIDGLAGAVCSSSASCTSIAGRVLCLSSCASGKCVFFEAGVPYGLDVGYCD